MRGRSTTWNTIQQHHGPFNDMKVIRRHGGQHNTTEDNTTTRRAIQRYGRPNHNTLAQREAEHEASSEADGHLALRLFYFLNICLHVPRHIPKEPLLGCNKLI